MMVDAQGVTVSRPDGTQRLTHAQVAALNNYDAQAVGLPRHMMATVVLNIEGRIDLPGFRLAHLIEPFNHMQPWLVYRRTGALMWVGERMMRLNPIQLRVLDAVAALDDAGADIAKRLRAWSELAEALHVPGRHHVLVENDLPRLRITSTQTLPANAMTREGNTLRRVRDLPEARWAMEPGRRYYLRLA